MPFHFINQIWYHLSGSRTLFVVITFTELYIGEELWVQATTRYMGHLNDTN